jgi:putative oxidoreductase
MERFLGPHTATLHAVLRIVAGLLFCQHGLPKLFGGFGSRGPAELFSQMGLAGIIEVFGGAAIALGLLTSPVAFLTSGEMAVAYFQFHFPGGFWPTINGGTPAILFCWIWLYISAAGAGPWSLDAKFRN